MSKHPRLDGGTFRNQFESTAWVLRRRFSYHGLEVEERILADGDHFKLIWALPPINQPIVDNNPNPFFWNKFTTWHTIGEGSEVVARQSVIKAFEDFWLVCKHCEYPIHHHFHVPKISDLSCVYPYSNEGNRGTFLKPDLPKFERGESKALKSMRSLLLGL
jgi:hypothetical protein